MKSSTPRRDLRNLEIGATYGRLTAVSYSHRDERRQAIWLFRCACGSERTRAATAVINGYIKQCSACSYKALSEKRTRHRERDAKIIAARQRGVSYSAIARELGITPSTVAGAVDRAKARGLLPTGAAA